MIELYRTKNQNVHQKVEILIARKLSSPFVILRNKNGKPYIDGNPLYFSITHSRGLALIALCDSPVGIDLELYGSGKKFSHILSRFTGRESAESGSSEQNFYANWTAKEAFVKMRGGSLASYLKRLEYFGGSLFFDGEPREIAVRKDFSGGVYAVCAEGYKAFELASFKLKRFRLRKGENY